MIVIVVMMMRVIMPVVMMAVIVTMMIVLLRLLRPQQAEQRPPLHPQEPQAHDADHRETDDHGPAHGVTHRLGRGVEQHCGGRHDDDCRQRLKDRRSEGQNDAAPPRLVIGDEVGRDHRLAVTGPRGV